MSRRLLAYCLALAMFSPAIADDYRFTVSNNSDQDIVRIEVSEDGESWAPFDIGSGIPAEESAVLVWDESTDDSNCEWRFRATFEEGYVAYSDSIDFCEEGVVIEFDFDE
ncbi:hypothetical protein [Pseudomarimonas arenosa]|uniref:Argininosuccinate lyase n=1 Tax=Pseudomarimonas arenosa TaxID=2774145 RepID=A0AAW3ZUC5_9GAMM|nr:hypothetical protein [Pseudomarimonas arenosa]MBD8527917.1 hypothetical protein [Pseudomarimonas arenosa]